MSRKGENIYKRKDGRWEARYIVGHGDNGHAKYRSVYGKTYKEAKKKKQEALLKLSRRITKISQDVVASSLSAGLGSATVVISGRSPRGAGIRRSLISTFCRISGRENYQISAQ